MEWHIREKGDIVGHQSLKEAPAHTNRKAMLRKLTRLYKFPCKKKVKLPISGTVTHQTLHCLL